MAVRSSIEMPQRQTRMPIVQRDGRRQSAWRCSQRRYVRSMDMHRPCPYVLCLNHLGIMLTWDIFLTCR